MFMCILEKIKISEEDKKYQIAYIKCTFNRMKYKIENNMELDNYEVGYSLKFIDKDNQFFYITKDTVIDLFKYIDENTIKAYLFCDSYTLITSKYQPIDFSKIDLDCLNEKQVNLFIDEIEIVENDVLQKGA